ncbi:MAG: TadE/TadG family type IV pilus assembly protein [Pseudomonadota bacterium]
MRNPFHKSKWKTLTKDRRGGVIVEFAMIVPVLLTILAGTLEFGYMAFARTSLEGAVRDAARFGITNAIAPDPDSTGTVTRESYVKALVSSVMDSFPIEGDLSIETLVYERFDDINQPEPWEDDNTNGVREDGECFSDINGNGVWDADMASAGLGDAGDVVVYTVTYPLPVLVPFLREFLGENGVVMLRASTVARNEPYRAPTLSSPNVICGGSS